MVKTAVRVQNLGKRYRISHEGDAHGKYRTLRDSLMDLAKAPLRRPPLIRYAPRASCDVLLATGLVLRVFHGDVRLYLAIAASSPFFIVTIVSWGILTRGRLPLEAIWLPWAAAVAVALWNRGKVRTDPEGAVTGGAT
jgi:hypothetical protein